jgi:hypothetical protein
MSTRKLFLHPERSEGNLLDGPAGTALLVANPTRT